MYILYTKYFFESEARKYYYTGGIGRDRFSFNSQRAMQFRTEEGARANMDRMNRIERENYCKEVYWRICQTTDQKNPYNKTQEPEAWGLWESLYTFIPE